MDGDHNKIHTSERRRKKKRKRKGERERERERGVMSEREERDGGGREFFLFSFYSFLRLMKFY